MGAILQSTFSNEFSWMKMHKCRLIFHWTLFPINNTPVMVQIMACRMDGAKPLSELTMSSLVTRVWVTRPQWVKWVIRPIYTWWWLWIDKYVICYILYFGRHAFFVAWSSYSLFKQQSAPRAILLVLQKWALDHFLDCGNIFIFVLYCREYTLSSCWSIAHAARYTTCIIG